MSASKPKLLLIGWDAADWQVIDRLLDEGKMPTLKSLIKRGSRGNIATLKPVLSPMLWTSIATGKRAYQHGIHGFVEADPLSGEISAVKSNSRKCKAVWNILNEAGLKTNLVNWWPSHPAEIIDGVSVSNHFHKSAPHANEPWPWDEHTFYPEEWKERLSDLRVHPSELSLNHIEPFIPQAAKLDPEKDAVLKTSLRILAHTASVHAAATEVMEQSQWDFMGVYQESIDHFSHLAMKYHPPRLDSVDEVDFERYRGIVEGAYRFHDMMLERLLELAGPDCNIMLVSDHGFESGSMRVEHLPDVPAAPALEHRPYGVFVAAGPLFKADSQVYGASLLDITPSILHCFGLPVGEDMEGQVLQSVFKRVEQPGTIDSWEDTGLKPRFTVERESSAGNLKQLQELGYINLPDSDKGAYVAAELHYNLCQSLMDGAKWEEALKSARHGWEKFSELRFGWLYGDLLLKLGKLDELQQHLQEINEAFPGQVAILYLEGLLYLQRNQQELALTKFSEVQDKGAVSTQLYNRIAQAFLASGNLKAAREYYGLCLGLDAENTNALAGLAQCMLELNSPAEAMTLLDRSLQLRFYQPRAHYLMAQAALALGQLDMARQALILCLDQAPTHVAARKLWQKQFAETATAEPAEAVIVASGLPRSGTSMLMQILQSVGVPVYSDEKRSADIHNPYGYLEHSRVKDIGRDNTWLGEARGQALKVVSPLLRFLPASENYKVIIIQRPLTEVILSQEIMKGRERQEVLRAFPFQLAVDMENEQQRLLNWLRMQPNMSFLTVEYYDCLEKTEQVLQEIAGFLALDIDIKNVATVVNDKLHRNKLGK